MTYRIQVFDRDAVPSQFIAMMALIEEGYKVKQEYMLHPKFRDYVVSKAWIEFETEEEAAIFKLTHL
jgi:hypothetical protein